VNLRSRIAAGILTLLAGLPILATACAVVCATTPDAAAGHHGSCAELAVPALRMSAAAAHDCATHDAASARLMVTIPERTPLRAMAPTLIVPAIHGMPPIPAGPAPHAPVAPPGGPPIAAPPVLRI
jgi:hypothetical protein